MAEKKISYIETHAHLDFEDYKDDRDELIASVFKSGCRAIINPGIDIASSHASLELAAQYNHIYSAVGVHPHEATRYLTSGDDVFDFLHRDMKTLEEFASKPDVIAIGECGLDFFRLQTNDPVRSKLIDMQKELFRLQLEIAKRKKLPVIMHIREAHEDVLELLDITQNLIGGVAHCYDGSWQHTDALLAMGMHIGFTANITYPKKEAIHDVIRKIPLERMLLETDSPYLSPQSRRGERNDPRSVIDVGKKIAEIKGIAEHDVFQQTSKNAMLLFGLPILE